MYACSSANADIANFISFDVYDINFSKVMNYSNLNFVLLQTTSKSTIIVEDLDQFLTDKSTAVSLFVDVYIYFSLCDFLTFKTLANSYLGLKDYKLILSGRGYFSEWGELGRNQRANDCESKLAELGYKVSHHGVTNGR
jgi:hypothetical protein